MCSSSKPKLSGSLTGRLWLDDLIGIAAFLVLIWAMVKGGF